MVPTDPVGFWNPARYGGSELALRIASAAVLAPLAIAMAYLGGWAFIAFWGLAAMIVLWEWTGLVAGPDRRAALMTGGAAVALAVALVGGVGNSANGVHEARLIGAVTVLAMGMLGVAALAPRGQRGWVASGIGYAGALAIAPAVLRSDITDGFVAMVLLYAIVWGTDVAAYFIGRAVGGPKLAPRFSPKKTWSGAIGGTVAAVVFTVIIGHLAGFTGLFALSLVAALLSAVSQVGDLFESMLKRRFGAKDSSQLIPGHGGLMDRLDGFVAATLVAAVFGLLRGGLDAPARGLLMW